MPPQILYMILRAFGSKIMNLLCTPIRKRTTQRSITRRKAAHLLHIPSGKSLDK
jgi:hypothetical protein